MTRSVFWIRTAAGSLWALLVLGALRSEPVTHAIIGEQLAVTHQWCGAWGCSASIPKLLAWQLPVIMTMVPIGWIAPQVSPWIGRNGLRLAAAIALAVAAWMGWLVADSATLGQLRSGSDVLRRIVFISVAGTSVVIPSLLTAAMLAWTVRRRMLNTSDTVASVEPGPALIDVLPPSRTNNDSRTGPQQSKDLSDVVIPHVDTTT